MREGTLARQSFDANSALLTKETATGTLTLTWDARGQLASARTTGANPVTETYGYDGLGRRISVTRNGVRTDWLYDGEHILAEYTGGAWASPSLRQVHGEGTDEILARTPLLNGAAQPTEYYAADGLGSLVALARADGSALRGNLRDAWGRTVWTAPGGALPPGPGFTGREQDATGLVYYRARYYDPAFGGIHGGQFLSRDPLGLAGGINEYAYVGNDPLNHIDPEGLLARQVGAGAQFHFNATVGYWASSRPTHDLAGLQRGLDIAGMAMQGPLEPLGPMVDAASGMVSAVRGDWWGAGTSLLAAVPVVGGLANAGKLTRGVRAGDAGAFASLKGVKGDGLTAHHMPQAAARRTGHDEGGALVMTQAEHVATRTYGSKGVGTLQADAGLSFRDVLAKDIRDVRSIVGPKYNQGLRDLTDYYRRNFPDLMRK